MLLQKGLYIEDKCNASENGEARSLHDSWHHNHYLLWSQPGSLSNSEETDAAIAE
jgi:hypothetical protein